MASTAVFERTAYLTSSLSKHGLEVRVVMQQVTVEALNAGVLMGPLSDWRESARAVRCAFRPLSSSINLTIPWLAVRGFSVLRDDRDFFISEQQLERAQGRPVLWVDLSEVHPADSMFCVRLLLYILEVAPMGLPHYSESTGVASERLQK